MVHVYSRRCSGHYQSWEFCEGFEAAWGVEMVVLSGRSKRDRQPRIHVVGMSGDGDVVRKENPLDGQGKDQEVRWEKLIGKGRMSVLGTSSRSG